ncbi:MAG: hypothetical protein IT173_13685 [Acidobacteria bacterium]|nr:hypothetical protein [Acidobacteriota bacterium]
MMSPFTKFACAALFALLFATTGNLAQNKPEPAKSPRPGRKTAATPEPAATPTPREDSSIESAISSLRFREIGPATMGGRINDIEVDPSDSRIIYAATAASGITKSVNGGTSWTMIFDKEAVNSIGDIAISPTNPSIIWAGTGESNNRQSSSWGNGIYKSLDGGKTWKHMGLDKTMAIARVIVHPRDPNIVYVAATGNLWAASPERGVYRTTDGGKTWQQVLKVNDDTGATEIAIDPVSPNILYAAMYQRRRTVFGFNGSGEHSALYKSNDGGDTWTKVTKGMPYDTENAPTPRPEGLLETGRIAIAVYPKDPDIVYVSVEHANGGIFRSNDKGETWTRMSEINAVPRPMYFSQIRIDPNNDQRLWQAGVTMQYSEDGGKTWSGNFSRAPHADTHGLWIDPKDSNHIIQGNDGGINITYDRGRTWEYSDTVPLGQFYEVGFNNAMPYLICGGLQDNNTWCGPSMSMNPRGITSAEWYAIGGGDGFYAEPDPNDSNTVYAESQDGNLLRRNVQTGESKSIRPREEEGEDRYRFQWNSPILISSFDSNTVYYPGNFVFKSTNRGDAWKKISPDLTTGVDRNKLEIMGKVPDKNTRSRHDGVQNYPTITTIAESPLDKNVLWAGTDDGNLQVTRDGQTWKNVIDKVSGVPKGTYVSRVIASRSAPGTAYVTFDGHRNADFKVYIYSTNDFGETWKNITANMPQNTGVANVVREHPRNPNLLFVGTEFGLFASFNKGESWTQIKLNLPTVPVDDIKIHPRENDLILGTHGRSIWVLDDMTPIEQMAQQVTDSAVYLFQPRQSVIWRLWNNRPLTSDKVFYGQNPPNGAIIQFYLKDALAARDNVTLTFQDSAGQTLRTVNCTGPRPAATPGASGGQGGPGGGGGGFGGFGGGGQQCVANKGLNRFIWDMRWRPAGPQAPPAGGGGGGGGGGGFGGGNQGFRVDPGDYTVKIKHGNTEISKTFKVIDDPRIVFSAEDRAKKKAALIKFQPVVTQAQTAQSQIVSLRTNLNNAIEAWKRPGAPRVPENIRKAAEDMLKKVDAAYVNWGTPPSLVSNISQAGPPVVELPTPLNQRAGQVLGAIESASTAPTEWELAQIEILSAKIPPAAEEVKNLISVDLAKLNNMMLEAKIPYIQPPSAAPGGGPGRPPGDVDDEEDDH